MDKIDEIIELLEKENYNQAITKLKELKEPTSETNAFRNLGETDLTWQEKESDKLYEPRDTTTLEQFVKDNEPDCKPTDVNKLAISVKGSLGAALNKNSEQEAEIYQQAKEIERLKKEGE